MLLKAAIQAALHTVRMEGGFGLSYNRQPKPYEKTALWPYPNIRWGIHTFMPTFDNRFQGHFPPLGPPWVAGFPLMQPGSMAKSITGYPSDMAQ